MNTYTKEVRLLVDRAVARGDASNQEIAKLLAVTPAYVATRRFQVKARAARKFFEAAQLAKGEQPE